MTPGPEDPGGEGRGDEPGRPRGPHAHPPTSVPDAGDADAAARRAAAGPGSPRAFAAGYERQSGDMLVYGGLAVAGIGVVAALVNGSDAFLIATAAGFASAAYFWPLVERRRPQLGASAAGLYVDRIGIIGWPAIEAIDLHETMLRTMRLSTLRVRLRVPLEKAVAVAEPVPLSKRFTTRNWKLSGNVLEVRLHTLSMRPDDVYERIRAFQEAARAASPRT